MRRTFLIWLSILFCLCGLAAGSAWGAAGFSAEPGSYGDAGEQSIVTIVLKRAAGEPFNVAATLIFFCAILHTFLTSRFLGIAHKWEHDHGERIARAKPISIPFTTGRNCFIFSVRWKPSSGSGPLRWQAPSSTFTIGIPWFSMLPGR